MPKPSRTIADVVGWLKQAPKGTTLTADVVLDLIIETGVHSNCDQSVVAGVSEDFDVRHLPWASALWVLPEETRIGKTELLEAVGRSKAWLYRHTSARGGCSRIPHRKLDGELVFVVGEMRDWLRQHEVIEVAVRGTGGDRATTPR